MLRSVAFSFAITVAFVALERSALALPKGAVSAPSQKVGAVTCGYINGNWVPGASHAGGYFLSHATAKANAEASAKKARGAAKRRLQQTIKRLAGKLRHEAAICTALQGTPVAAPSETPTVTPTAGNPFPTPTVAAAVRFNLSGAKALVLGAASANSFADSDSVQATVVGGSNMRKLNALGQLEEVLSSGSVTVSKFYVGPNGKLYAVLSQKVNLETGAADQQNGCLLLEVDPDSPVPSCIDWSIDAVQWTDREISPPIQFDSLGRLYYLGYRWGTNGGAPMVLLRRYDSTQPVDQRLTDLVTQNIMVQAFFVDPDGYVLISGSTSSSSAYWIREVSPEAVTRNLITSSVATWLRLFPDNNVYFGLMPMSGGTFGVKRYLRQSRALDNQFWMAWSSQYSTTPIETHWAVNDLDECKGGAAFDHYQPLCSYAGSQIRAMHRTTGGKMFGIAALNADGVALQYYPEVRTLPTTVYKAAVMRGIFTNLLISGLDAENQNKLVLYDTSNNSELNLFSGTGCENIDVYHIEYSVGDNRALFDGQRFSDSKYVICGLLFDTMQCSCAATGDSKLEDLQSMK